MRQPQVRIIEKPCGCQVTKLRGRVVFGTACNICSDTPIVVPKVERVPVDPDDDIPF